MRWRAQKWRLVIEHEIPKVTIETTVCESHEKVCPHCGTVGSGEFSEMVKGTGQYGLGIEGVHRASDWEAVDVATETGEISFGARPPDGVSLLVAEPSPPVKNRFSPQNPA